MSLKDHTGKESELPKQVKEELWGHDSAVFFFLVSRIYLMVVKPMKTILSFSTTAPE